MDIVLSLQHSHAFGEHQLGEIFTSTPSFAESLNIEHRRTLEEELERVSSG